MPTSTHTSNFVVKIDGQNIAENLYDALEEIVVDTRLNLPGMFTLRFHDPQLTWVDDASLEIGKEVEISAAPAEESGSEASTSAVIVIKGEITALEPDFPADGKTSLLVRGYDKMHRLHRGRQTKTFLQVSDSDLVSKIAKEAGLQTGTVDSTSQRYEHVLQYNQTNLEFLMERAERIGYHLLVEEGKLYFKKGDATLGDGPTLTYLESLIRFEPRWTASHQANTTKVLGWDSKAKQAISGQGAPGSSLNQGGMEKTGGALAQSSFSAAEEIIANVPVMDASDAKNIADGMANEIARSFVEAEGECFGHPGVKPGYKITISGVGKRFKGKYLVTAATHIYKASGYKTIFRISGQRTDTFHELLKDDAPNARGMVNGFVTGIVTNLMDPDNLGRVKVKFSWLGEIESWWMRIASPMAGASRGFMILPEVNDEVLIGFEHGEVNRPVIVGTLWNNVDKPPKNNSDVVKGGKVTEHILKSRSGHLIILDDSDGKEQIVIRDKTNKNEIIIDSSTNTITLNMDKDLKITAKGETTIESTGKMTLKSQADFSLQCMNFKVEAQANADLKANAAVNVQNAAAKIALSGPTVNINNGALEVT